MNWRRSVLFVAIFCLAATMFLPRLHYQAAMVGLQPYQFFLLQGRDIAPIDYAQWRLNLCVAALVGLLISNISLARRK